MASTINSLASTSYTNSVSSSSSKKVPLSEDLIDYLDNSGDEGKKLSKIIKKLVSDSNGDLTDSKNLSDIESKGKEFIKSYNKIVDYCRKNSDDEELQKLTKNLTNLTSKNKSDFSKLGITVQNFGKLKITDSVLYSNSISDKSFSKFITDNSGKFTKMFDKINKIARSLEKDNTAFLSDNTLKKMNDYFWKSNSSNGGTNTGTGASEATVNNSLDASAVSNYSVPGSTFSNYA